MTQYGKACSGLYPDVIMLPNGSLLNKIAIKCQFFLVALYFKYISVLTSVRHQSHPNPPLHGGWQRFFFSLLLMFCTATEWLRTSFNYGCSPNDPAEHIIRSREKLMAYLSSIIVQIFFSISFPSVTSHLFELYAGDTTIQPRTPIIKKKFKITLWQKR